MSRPFLRVRSLAPLAACVMVSPVLAQSCVPSIAPTPLAPAPGGVTPPSFLPLQSLAAGDFNGDGRTDLVSIDTTATSVNVRMALPNDTFAPPVSTTLGTTIFRTQTIITDLDGDGIPDVLAQVSNGVGVPATRGVWFGHADGTFTFGFDAAMNFALALVTDLNTDGRPDLVGFPVNASGATTSDLRTWINQSAGGNRAFTSVPLATFANPGFPIVRDLDGDGRLDLFVARINSTCTAQCAYQALPTQPGAMGAFVVEPTTTFGTTAASQVFLMDVDGDGRLDLVMPSILSFMTVCPGIIASGRSLMFGSPVSVDTFTGQYVGTILESRATLADVNSDGRPDLVRQMLFAGQTQTTIGIKLASAGTSAAPESNVFGPELDFPGVDLRNIPLVGLGPRVAPAVVDLTGDGLPEILANGPDSDPPVAIPSNALTITRPGGVVIDAGPSPARVRAGQIATLSVAAHPTTVGTAINFRWRKDGIALVESARIAGARTATLSIFNTTAADTGVYTVDVSTACETRSASTYADVGNTGSGCVADIDDGSATGTPDGGVTIDDLLFFLAHFEQGC